MLGQYGAEGSGVSLIKRVLQKLSMDKTIEIVLVAAVGMIVVVIALFLVNAQSDEFSDTTGTETEAASCELLEIRYKQAVSCTDDSACGGSAPCDTPSSLDIKNNDASECDTTSWTPYNVC